MVFGRTILCVVLLGAATASAQPIPVIPAPRGQLPGPSGVESSPDHLRKYTDCMRLARLAPLKALPAAEK
ncbi:MAG: hypothetical protein IBJ17_14215 [Reyranella sp.]|nr:hypothetical protein [Reyranella sp.]